MHFHAMRLFKNFCTVSSRFQRALALDRPGFYAGLPCALEWGEARRWADGVYGGNRSGAGTQTTVACVFINGGWGQQRQ